jgi:hypothetical protein
MHYQRALSVAVTAVIALLALADDAAGGPPPARISFKPTRDTVEYWIRSRERHARQVPAKRPEWTYYDALELVRQTVTPTPDGLLSVKVESLAKDLKVNDVPVSDAAFKPRTFTYAMTARGERMEMSASDDAAIGLSPVLPEGEVAPGFSWEAVVPASTKLPEPIKVKHSFDRIEMLQGVPCAVIVSEGAAKGQDASGARFALKLAGSTAIALKEGAIVRARTFTTFTVRAARPAPGGHQIVRQQIDRIVTRRSSAEAAPPEPPARK